MEWLAGQDPVDELKIRMQELKIRIKRWNKKALLRDYTPLLRGVKIKFFLLQIKTKMNFFRNFLVNIFFQLSLVVSNGGKSRNSILFPEIIF